MSELIIRLDTEKLVTSMQEIEELVKKNYGTWYINQPINYSQEYRDMTYGWELISTVKDYHGPTHGPFEPGVYALVYDADNTSTNPVLEPKTILFGESTRDAYLRVITHTGALKGHTTNSTNKWEKHLPFINSTFNTDLTANLDKIKIYFRPHSLTDDQWKTLRDHSVWMETSCSAQYYLFHKRYAPGNTRDLPTAYQINEYKKFLVESGHKI